MQTYQEEYISNLQKISELMALKKSQSGSSHVSNGEHSQAREHLEQIVSRNMLLLRKNLFPVLDHLFEAAADTIQELEEFAGKLFDGRRELDVGLFCQIRRALLSRARQVGNRNDMIRQLYWLGMGYNRISTKLIGLDWAEIEGYMSQMRLCFMEAAAYLKYFDEIRDIETKGYIIRSRANVALGQFKSSGDKIRLVKYTLQILQDESYREKAPELPWERYLYMTHQQMAASISRNKEKAMSPEDIVDVMESVYIVYEKQLKEATDRGENPPARTSFSYDSINYYCGLDTLDGLLEKMEVLIDAARPDDFSREGTYRLISLPAFYCNFLQDNPEKIPARTDYIDSLYERALDYVERFPQASENELLFFHVRQLMCTFVETETGIPYGDFVSKLLIRFLPDDYIHSYIVAKAAVELCTIIMEEEPCFFDDIEEICRIADPRKKLDTVLEYARNASLLHDIGKISFTSLYAQSARQWFEEEYEMAHLHTLVGEKNLAMRPSTRKYAPVALGHHSWYDGSHGYPASYRRLECAYRQMVDVIGLADWLDNVTDANHLYTGVQLTFEEALETAVSLEGKRFSPLLTARLRDRRVVERLERIYREERNIKSLAPCPGT